MRLERGCHYERVDRPRPAAVYICRAVSVLPTYEQHVEFGHMNFSFEIKNENCYPTKRIFHLGVP
jgi:hypothetical protein